MECARQGVLRAAGVTLGDDVRTPQNSLLPAGRRLLPGAAQRSLLAQAVAASGVPLLVSSTNVFRSVGPRQFRGRMLHRSGERAAGLAQINLPTRDTAFAAYVDGVVANTLMGMTQTDMNALPVGLGTFGVGAAGLAEYAEASAVFQSESRVASLSINEANKKLVRLGKFVAAFTREVPLLLDVPDAKLEDAAHALLGAMNVVVTRVHRVAPGEYVNLKVSHSSPSDGSVKAALWSAFATQYWPLPLLSVAAVCAAKDGLVELRGVSDAPGAVLLWLLQPTDEQSFGPTEAGRAFVARTVAALREPLSASASAGGSGSAAAARARARRIEPAAKAAPEVIVLRRRRSSSSARAFAFRRQLSELFAFRRATQRPATRPSAAPTRRKRAQRWPAEERGWQR